METNIQPNSENENCALEVASDDYDIYIDDTGNYFYFPSLNELPSSVSLTQNQGYDVYKPSAQSVLQTCTTPSRDTSTQLDYSSSENLNINPSFILDKQEMNFMSEFVNLYSSKSTNNDASEIETSTEHLVPSTSKNIDSNSKLNSSTESLNDNSNKSTSCNTLVNINIIELKNKTATHII